MTEPSPPSPRRASTGAELAFLEGERGDLTAIERGLARLAGDAKPEARAWSAALGALRWSFDPTLVGPESSEGTRRLFGSRPGDAPAPRDIEAVAGGTEEARRGAWLACAIMRRASLLGFDGAAVERWRDVELRLGLEAPTRDGRAGIDAALGRALAALGEGRIADAVEPARRAFLMAQAEALPQLEWLAGLTLARVRRRARQPHLALHILTALARVAPALWHPWICWEMLLAGGEGKAGELMRGHPRRPGDLPDGPAARAALALAALLAAARAGERSAFEARAAELEAALAPAAPLASSLDVVHEAAAVVAALDSAREPPATLAPWCRGLETETPFGLYGMGTAAEAAAPDPEAIAVTFVVAAPGRAGRRVLRPGRALSGATRELSRDAEADTGGARTETGIAALMLAGPDGLSREDFFKSVYGFPFVLDLHQSALEVLVHRMRARVAGAGEIARGDDKPRITLRLEHALSVPDVRCTLPIADRILRLLAVAGPSGTDDAARALQISARTVQRVLQQLTADGACRPERAGRHVVYKIQDTVFTDITSLTGRLNAPS